MKANVASVVLWDKTVTDKDRPVTRGGQRQGDYSHNDKCEIKFAEVEAAYDWGGGVYLKMNVSHVAARGVLLFYAGEHAEKLRVAIGDALIVGPPKTKVE